MCKYCSFKERSPTDGSKLYLMSSLRSVILIRICAVANMDISLLYFWSDKDKNFGVTSKNLAHSMVILCR